MQSYFITKKKKCQKCAHKQNKMTSALINVFYFNFTALGNPVDKTLDENYQNDDYYQQDPKDDSEYDYDENEKSTVSSTTDVSEPYVSNEYTETVDVGKSIILRCKGSFTDSPVFMW
jgi:hypothetical protein